MDSILIVDDSIAVRMQVGRSLKSAGLGVLEARDGVEALDRIAAGGVGLVLCDVNMPNMDGFQFLEALSKTPFSTLPVVMLTTEGQPPMMQRARELGAKGWLTKPFKAELFLEFAKKVLQGS